MAIEYNGEQHYVPVQVFGGQVEFEKRQGLDKLKSEKCKLNNCILYYIKYDCLDYDKIEKDIGSFLKD